MRRKLRRFKRHVHNFILIAITVFAFAALCISTWLLAEEMLKAFVTFLLSALWLWMFGKANPSIEL